MVKMTVGIDGMMCNMCEAHVNEAIRKAFKVKKVTSDHKAGETVILAEQELDRAAIEKAVGETGYRVTGYQCEPYEKKGLFGFGK